MGKSLAKELGYQSCDHFQHALQVFSPASKSVDSVKRADMTTAQSWHNLSDFTLDPKGLL